MKRITTAVVGLVGVIFALSAAFGTGVAAAQDQFAGKSYAAVEAALDGTGYTTIISTRTGSFLPDDQCTVTRSQIRQNKGGKAPTILLFLNCNAAVATGGSPGNSAASPEGRAAQDAQATADWINANPDACAATKKSAADCKAFCDAHSTLCTA